MIKFYIKNKNKHDEHVAIFSRFRLQVLRVSQNGSLVLHDIVRSQELCQLDAPDNVRLAEPWQPALCLADDGKALYFRGNLKVFDSALNLSRYLYGSKKKQLQLMQSDIHSGLVLFKYFGAMTITRASAAVLDSLSQSNCP